MNDEQNAPVAEEVQETDPAISKDMPVAEAPEEPVEPTSEAAEAAPAEAEAPAEPLQPDQPESPTEEVDWSKYVPPLNQPLPVDDEGQVDPIKYREQLKQEMRFEQNEIRTWQSLEKKYPELSKDAGLREMVLANRLFDVNNRGQGTLESSAQRVFERIGIARNEGKAAQATSITVQKSAALAQPTGAGQAAAAPDMSDRIKRGDQTAIQQTLSQWIKDGKA